MTDLPGGLVRRGPAIDPLRVLLSSTHRAGEVGIVEMEMAPGSRGPPLHLHPTHGEGFYVLTGLLTFQLGSDVITAGPGSWLFVPRTTPHTLANHGPEPGRLLCVFAPGGFERRFERMLAQTSGGPLPAGLSELADAERATEVVGPPLNAARPFP
jgi:quercetin dioxygenase-like cupin family protein